MMLAHRSVYNRITDRTINSNNNFASIFKSEIIKIMMR